MSNIDVEAASGEVPLINHSGLPDTVIRESAGFQGIAKQLSQWVEKARMVPQHNSLFDRGAYTPPENPYQEMRAARRAVKSDDVVSGVAETTEGFAFAGVKWECENADDADVFNQVNGDLNLDAVVRRIWREDFTYSTCYIAQVWGWKTYTVRGRNPAPEVGLDKITTTDPTTGQGTDTFHPKRDPETNLPVKRGKGTRRKKQYQVYVPTGLRILDPCKIVPVGLGPLGEERFAWYATPEEIGAYFSAYDGSKVDVGMLQFFLGPYEPSKDEALRLANLGINPRQLLLINPDFVFCHQFTKPDYERFPDIRLKSCFHLLDLKQQLIQADRATLIGAANYILLVRKGDKDMPATQEEIDNLKSNYQFVAKLPVIISDHRLEIEIIAPKVDLTLQREKYDTLDARLLARLLGTLTLGTTTGRSSDTNDTLSHAVARALENRRHMLRRTLERNIAKKIVEHPLNKGKFEEEPNLVYTPRNITLGWDQPLLQALLSLRTQKEISRETLLEMFGLDQNTEAMRREIEADNFDHIFQTTVPFSSPDLQGPNGGPMAPGVAGGLGGRPVGGGKPPANAAKPAAKTKAGTTTPKKKGTP